jgi:hypothetical protein
MMIHNATAIAECVFVSTDVLYLYILCVYALPFYDTKGWCMVITWKRQFELECGYILSTCLDCE